MTRSALLFALAAFFAGSPALAGDTVTVNVPGGATQIISSIGLVVNSPWTSPDGAGQVFMTIGKDYPFNIKTLGGNNFSTQSMFVGNLLIMYSSSNGRFRLIPNG